MFTRRQLLHDRLLLAGLVILSCVLGAAIYLVARMSPQDNSVLPAHTVHRASSPYVSERLLNETELNKLHLGMDQPAAAKQATSELPPATGDEPVHIPFKVRGIIHSSAERSVAFIEAAGKIGLYRKNDVVEGWRIAAIDIASVTFARDGQERTLGLEFAPYSKRPLAKGAGRTNTADRPVAVQEITHPAASTALAQLVPAEATAHGFSPIREMAVVSSSPPPRQPPTTVAANATVAVPSQVVEQVRQDPMSALRGASIEPVLNKGQMEGLVLRSVQPGSLAATYGLAPGDKIIAVNGQPLNSVERAFELYNRYRNADSIRVTLVRNGQRRDIVFYQY